MRHNDHPLKARALACWTRAGTQGKLLETLYGYGGDGDGEAHGLPHPF